MGAVGRRCIAVAGAGAAFVASWWICARFTTLDTGTAVGVAGAALAVTLTVLWWWATRDPPAAVSLSAQETLRRAVGSREDEVRKALLGGLTPANLAYDHDTHTTDTVSPGQNGPPGPGRLMLRALGGLLRFDVEGSDSGTKNEIDGDLQQIGAYFAELTSKRLVVLGKPGAGKTVLAIELVLQLLRQAEQNPAADALAGRVPVRFSAASWLPGQDLPQWLTQRLVLDYGLTPATAQDLVDGRRVLPVLDGLDELDPEPLVGPPSRALAMLDELNSYSDLGRSVPVVVTCREERYEQITQAGPKLVDARIVIIRDLDVAQLRDYLHARYSGNPEMYLSWDKVLNLFDSPAGLAARRVLTTPWRLLLAVTAAEDGADPGQLLAAGIGEDTSKAERRIVQTLLATYIPAAARLKARSGRRARHYQSAKVAHWMRSLATHLAWQADQARITPDPPAGMTGIDIVPHLLWPIGGPRLVRRLHAALGLLVGGIGAAAIAYALVGPPSVWVANISRYFHGGYPFPANIGLFLGVVCLAFGIPAWLAADLGQAWPVPRITARTRNLTASLGSGLVIGLTASLAVGLVLGLVYGLVIGLAAGFVYGLAAGLAFALTSASRLGEDRWLPDASLASPMSALGQESAYALMLGLAIGLAIGLAFALESRLLHGPNALAVGLVAGFTAALIFGLRAWISSGRYMIGRAASTAQRRLPLRLRSFLTWACESGLLRVSGATYQFRHRELQDWLHPPDVIDKAPVPSDASMFVKDSRKDSSTG